MNEKFHKVVFLCVCVLFSYRALGTVDLELNRVAQASLLLTVVLLSLPPQC